MRRYRLVDATIDTNDDEQLDWQGDDYGDDEAPADFDGAVSDLAAAWRKMVQGSNPFTQWGIPEPEPDADPEFWNEVQRLATARGVQDLETLYETARRGRDAQSRDLYYALILNAAISLGRVNHDSNGTGGVTTAPDYETLSRMPNEERQLYREAQRIAGQRGYNLNELDLTDRMKVYQFAEQNLGTVHQLDEELRSFLMRD